MKFTDVASPLLMANAALGNNIPNATLALRRSGEGAEDFLVVTMKDVIMLGHKHRREFRRADGIRNAQLFVRARELQARGCERRRRARD
jgi:type VI protein secretion system component Hcp